jgi:hypothetical protein
MMVGDGESQPTEGVDALEDLANSLTGEQEQEEGDDQRDAPEEDGEESDEEQVEEGEDEEGDEEEEEEDPTVVIKHDGKEVELKLSEVKDLAQQGFDYSKKTMALAEDRKAVEATKAELADAWQRNVQALERTEDRLGAFIKFMESQVGDPPPIEWAQQDAAYYLAQKQLYDDRKDKLARAHEAAENVRQEAQRVRQARIAETAAATEKALRDTLPGWNDARMNELADYLRDAGITPDSALEAFVQKGVWELAHKAKAYDQIQADKAKLKPKAELKKVQKPAAQVQTGKAAERMKREAAFNKNPSVDALADLLR